MQHAGNVYLVGMMGAGKTTVGRTLARRLKLRPPRLDEPTRVTAICFDDWVSLALGAVELVLERHFPEAVIDRDGAGTIDTFDARALLMALRVTEASSYTLLDTPAFTGLALPMREALDALG